MSPLTDDVKCKVLAPFPSQVHWTGGCGPSPRHQSTSWSSLSALSLSTVTSGPPYTTGGSRASALGLESGSSRWWTRCMLFLLLNKNCVIIKQVVDESWDELLNSAKDLLDARSEDGRAEYLIKLAWQVRLALREPCRIVHIRNTDLNDIHKIP